MPSTLSIDEQSSKAKNDARGGWPVKRAGRLVPALIPLVLAALLCVEYDTPDPDVLRYLVAFGVTVVLPGTLVHRWLRGRQDLLISDLSLGAATGLALQLLGWFAFTMLGLSSWMWLWTVVLLAPFAAVPALRRHATLGRYPKQVPVGVAWTMSALASALVWRVAHSWFAVAPLPLKPLMWYPDDYWHLASAAELQRSVLPRVPQVADLTFAYHWFSNAHMGVMSTLTGIDLPVVVARLWIIPVLFVLVGLSVAVMVKLTGAAWPSLVVAAFLLTSGNLNGVTWLGLDGVMALLQHSPSQVFSLIPMMLIIHVATDVLRGRPIGRGWALLFLMLLFCAGSKSSVLPVLIGGAVLAGAVALLRRDGWRRCVNLAVAMVVAMVVMAPLVSGSSAGTAVQLFALVRRFPVWREVTGISPLEVAVNTGPLIPGLGRPGAVTLLLLILLAYAVQYAWVLVALPLLSFRRDGDLTAWFLLGTGVAGWWAMMLVDQDGMSQAYFMRGAVVALHVLGAWGLHRVWSSTRVPLRRWVFAICALIGVALGWIVLEVATAWSAASASDSATSPPAALAHGRLAVSLALIVAPLLLGLLAFWVLHRRGSRAAFPVLVAGTAALVLAPVLRPMIHVGDAVTYRPQQSLTISSSEVTAARWVAEQTPTRDVIATNLHCLKFVTKPNCDARSFWVSGLAERAVLVEGWAYTEAAHEAHGRNGFSSRQQPFADPATFALNEAAFAEPTQAGLDQLYARGVRWLFADRRASTVSPELATLADLRFRDGDADVYQLRAP